jgi:hypothetical protein
MRRACLLLALLLVGAGSFEQQVRAAIGDPDKLRTLGQRVLPVLAKIYESSDEPERLAIAGDLYVLAWKSPDAKRALMRDVHTQNDDLRVAVQYALGRVSDDPDVVSTLADIMQHDGSAHFRDKAACALAYDQVHLTDRQKVALLRQVIPALRSPNSQVRQIAIQILQIRTGQSKGFRSLGKPAEREAAVKEWERWIEEYARNL